MLPHHFFVMIFHRLMLSWHGHQLLLYELVIVEFESWVCRDKALDNAYSAILCNIVDVQVGFS